MIVALLVLGLVVLPITIFFFQKTQETRSRAEKTVNLVFEPNSQKDALQIPAGTTFTVDVYVNPGANSVSFVKVEMLYDTTKFALAGGFIPNRDAFSQIIEGPINTPGKVTATLSVGSDLSKALRTNTKIGILALKALNNVPANTVSDISFGPGSQALSVSNNSSFDENVIANKTPLTVKINRPNLTCGTSPTDVMLVMDKSGSMNDKAGSSGTKLFNAKSSANSFIDTLSNQETNRVGLVSFASAATLENGLTTAFSTVKNHVNSLSATGETCIECGINKANQEIAAHKRPVKNVVILLTDGIANHIEGNNGLVGSPLAEQRALAAAQNGHTANGTVFFTIGLGKDVDSDFLSRLAKRTGGQYYYSPTTDQLNDIYTQISQLLAKGSVTGTVFFDAEKIGVFEPNDPGIPGVLLQLYPLGSSTSQLISTDSKGTYTIPNICDGTYTIKQMVPTGYKQLLPQDIRGYTVTITNGSAVTDKNFGDARLPRCSDGIDNDGNGAIDAKDSTCHTDGNINNPGSYDPNKDGEYGNSTCSDSKDNNGDGLIDGQDPACHTDGDPNNPLSYDPSRSEDILPTKAPTPTTAPSLIPTSTPPTIVPSAMPSPTPAGTGISINVLLHGIGNSGDNANPTANSLSNKTPLHPQRSTTVSLYDINNTFVATASGTVQYSSASGSFVGMVYTQSPITAGKYSTKIRTDNHLTRLVSGIQNLTADQTNQLPITELVAGDINNDNRLNILDYNLLLGCYSDLSAAPDCNSAKKLAADLNDDDAVNQFDYNLFLREISTQPGE